MNGLDFFRSCNTNVRTIDNVSKLQCSIYVPVKDQSLQVEPYQALAYLRDRDLLCALVGQDIWMFATSDDSAEDVSGIQQFGFQGKVNGTLLDIAQEAGNGRPNDLLLDAIEGSISYTLAKQHGITHAGYFTWLFNPDAATERSSMIIKLDANLSENDTLHLSTRTTQPILREASTTPNDVNRAVYLAPIGRKAAILDETSLPATAALHRPSVDSYWKKMVASRMLAEGMAISPEEIWLKVETADRGERKSFLWPQRLCFTRYSLQTEPSTLPARPSWQSWFDVGEERYTDVLREAEEWVAGAAERERILNSTSDEQAHAQSQHVVAETPLAISSPFNQRLAEHQAAIAGIYPTPPDGFVAGQLPHQPTSDGPTGSMHVEHSTLSNELQLPINDGDQPRADSIDSTAVTQAYHLGSDDLFGEMGEIDFGTNEVGDADFDYFDEPGDFPHTTSVDNDVDMSRDDSALDAGIYGDAGQPAETSVNDTPVGIDEVAASDSRPTSSHEQSFARADVHVNVDPDADSDGLPDGSPSPVSPTTEPEQPLDPWGIRRQLMPMIPASAALNDIAQSPRSRRGSTFDRIAFNDNLDLASKYADRKPVDVSIGSAADQLPNIALPRKKEKARAPGSRDPDSGVADLDSSSEDDSNITTGIDVEEELLPRLPWDTRKRKRTSYYEQDTSQPTSAPAVDPMDEWDDKLGDGHDAADMEKMLDKLIRSNGRSKLEHSQITPGPAAHNTSSDVLPSIEDLFEFEKMDLIYVAQILSEQAGSSVSELCKSSTTVSPLGDNTLICKALEDVIRSTSARLLPNMRESSVLDQAITRESGLRLSMSSGKMSQAGHPRTLQRSDSVQFGPDYFSIPAPYIRIQRGSDTMEMLPPALSFWNALGIGPPNGQKDITPIALVPGNTDLINVVRDFVKDLGGVYESRKLGSFSTMPDTHDCLDALEFYDEGCAIVRMDEDAPSIAAAVRTFVEVCEELGSTLAAKAQVEPDRTIVILMFDPFQDPKLSPYLCGCFWKLCKAYRQHIPKAHAKSPRSDLVLQILPISLVAAPDELIIQDLASLSTLATELYDRCPPSAKAIDAMDLASALPIFAAPAVELASVPPKRIMFHLTAEAPSDLMQEGSVLHIAYAVSSDRQWVTTNWIDATGRYQMGTALSMRGKSFEDLATEIWERTLSILTARDVTWRIFIVTDAEMDVSEAKCWRSIVTSKSKRPMLLVTLLSVQTTTSLQLTAPSSPDSNSASVNTAQGNHFLTPGSTPQGTTMTVSPDASGPTVAPPTPAPTETASTTAENDPDAHLIDIADETWAMLLPPTSFSSNSNSKAAVLCKGIMFRRGDNPAEKMEDLGVEMHWDIRVRPGGVVEEGLLRFAEQCLREVLRMYRSLGLLARARGIAGGGEGGSKMLPLHLAAATRAAEALGWFKV